VGLSVSWPAQNALLASLAGQADCSAIFSVRHASMNAGLGLGALGAAAVVSVTHPGTFTAVYLADALSFLAFLPVLARLAPLPADPVPAPGRQAAAPGRQAPAPGRQAPASGRQAAAPRQPRNGYREVPRDKAFVRVWLLTAVVVTVSFGQFQCSLPGYATRSGGIGARGLSLAFAANTLTVVIAQLFVLRWLSGRRRTTGAALAAAAWAVSWAVVIAAGHLGGGAGAEAAFAAAAVIFALGETLLSPTLPAIMNDLAAPEAAGRYNGLGVLAFTAGFLAGPAIGGAALGAGWGTGLFAVLAAVCLAACAGALRLSRHLPPRANRIAPSAADVAGTVADAGDASDITPVIVEAASRAEPEPARA
jgi:MFS transporter